MKMPILLTPLHWRAGMALGALSALAMWLAFFPVDWGFVAWFALVPLLLVVRLGTAWSIRLAGFVGAYGFYLAALSWMRVADPTMARAWPLLALYCTLFSWLAIWLLRRIERRLGLPFVITLPVVWTAVEFIRGRFLGGFAWYFLGHSQHDYLLLRQSADVAGELALTFLVAAVNGLFADLLTRCGRSTVVSLIGVGSLLFVFVMYGAWRVSQFDFGTGPKVAILQGNISQDLKNGVFANGFEAGKKFINEHYAQLSSRVIAERPDLVIWPETSIPIEIAILRDVPIESLNFQGRLIVEGGNEYLARIARQTGINTLVGTNTTVLGPGKTKRASIPPC